MKKQREAKQKDRIKKVIVIFGLLWYTIIEWYGYELKADVEWKNNVGMK